MSTFEEFSFSPEDFSGIVRLFPLPNLVLFPHVMQPLHIFEPRYCDLLNEALSGDRLIAMAVLAPGWEADYDARPALYGTACLGRITAHYSLASGAHNVLLSGLKRVEIVRELLSAKSFREAEARIHDDVCPEAVADKLRRRLRGACERVLPALVKIHGQVEQLLEGDMPLGALTDIISYTLDIPIPAKTALLTETDVGRRTEMLLEHLAASRSMCCRGPPAHLSFPPRSARIDDGRQVLRFTCLLWESVRN